MRKEQESYSAEGNKKEPSTPLLPFQNKHIGAASEKERRMFVRSLQEVQDAASAAC